MRIVMVNKYYPPHVGGVEFHVRDLAEGLVAAGHQVRVIVSNNERTMVEEVINGVEVVRLPRLFERASTPVVRHFGRVLAHEANAADILHFHFPYPWGEFEWVGQLASKYKPYVVTYHADIVRQKRALALYKPFLEKFLNRARLIMASSPQLIEYSPFLSQRTDKCRQVNFGLGVERIAYNERAEARAEVFRQLYAGDGLPIVLFVGRLIYYKGIEVLARAIPEINAHFVIIGRGPDRSILDALARDRDAGLKARIHILDYASDEDLIAWFHAADVLTLPSVEPSEAFGLVQIEAHAAGTPVVSTRLESGVPYANLDGLTGLTVEPRDPLALAGAINALLSDSELRSRLGKQARDRALSDFTVPAMVAGVTAVYEEALSESSDLPDLPEVGTQ